MKEQHVLIDFMKQSEIKNLTNIKLLNESPFYSRQKDPIIKLYLSKLCIKDLFKVLLHKTKGFKYQITLHVFL